MAEEKLIRNPKLIIGEAEKVEAEVVGADDIVVVTDEEFYTAKEVDDLLKKSGSKLPILTHMFSDHIINDMSWLRADTFSWQSGDVYVAAYEHLAGDLDTVQKLYCWIGEKMGDKYYTYSENPSVGETTTDGEAIKRIDSYGRPVVGADYLERYPEGDMLSTQTDTIGDITITYYLADDGHKICLPDQESNISALYEATGVAWYYILDTTNRQFKLPRTKWGFTGLRDSVGGYVEAGLPTATQMYLYFYVGNFEQSAIEQTAGFTSEILNATVADINLSNVPANYDYVVESQLPTSANGYTWYRKYKSGWVEQGGTMTWDLNNNNGWITNSVSFPQIMQDTSYTPIFSIEEFPGLEQEITVSSDVKNTSSLIAGMYREHPRAITNPVYIYWFVVGVGQI